MKKQIMKRAWEIYRTLVGDHIAKLSMAIRQAWTEVKATAEKVENTYDAFIERAKTVGNRWTKYGKDRIYLDSRVFARFGFITEYYKSGNICYAEFDGEKISNYEAGKIFSLMDKCYINLATEEKVFTVNSYNRYVNILLERINATINA